MSRVSKNIIEVVLDGGHVRGKARIRVGDVFRSANGDTHYKVIRFSESKMPDHVKVVCRPVWKAIGMGSFHRGWTWRPGMKEGKDYHLQYLDTAYVARRYILGDVLSKAGPAEKPVGRLNAMWGSK